MFKKKKIAAISMESRQNKWDFINGNNPFHMQSLVKCNPHIDFYQKHTCRATGNEVAG